MVVMPAPFPALGFDCITTLDAVRAASLKEAGMSFAIRYLGSVTAAEIETILKADLCFMPVTYSRAPGWAPSAALGNSDGVIDVSHLLSAGVPKGTTVWIDLEGAAGTAADVSGWVNARAAVMRKEGYDVGLYVGSDSVLDPGQLYALVQIDRYWKSLSDVPTPSTCGFCMMQLRNTTTIAGTEVDVDVIQYDYLNRLPWVVGP
jgi:hypothetical protein